MDVNKLINGRTLLHYAADYGQGDVLRYLLEKGADANVSFSLYIYIYINSGKPMNRLNFLFSEIKRKFILLKWT